MIGANSTPVPGTNNVASGPLGTGTLSLSAGTTLLSTGAFTVSNTLTLSTTTKFDGLNNLNFTGTTNLPGGTANISVAAPQQTVGLIGSFAGPATIISKTGYGTLNLAGDFGGTVSLPTGGSIGLLDDGDGTSLPEDIASVNLDSDTAAVLTVGRSGVEYFPYFTNAVNKTIVLSGLTLDGASLTVNNNNGYGVKTSAAQVLTATDQIYSVATASASNVVQGLTLNGVLSGPSGILKQGAGTLVLGNAGNTFGGAGKLIDIQGGVVAVATDEALGNASNGVRLGIAGTAGVGLRATGTFPTARTITLSQATMPSK